MTRVCLSRLVQRQFILIVKYGCLLYISIDQSVSVSFALVRESSLTSKFLCTLVLPLKAASTILESRYINHHFILLLIHPSCTPSGFDFTLLCSTTPSTPFESDSNTSQQNRSFDLTTSQSLLSLLQPMPQRSVNHQEACAYAALTSQALHQHDLQHPAPQYDAVGGTPVEKKHRSRLESGVNDVTVDLPSYIKDKVIENDIGRMYTEHFLPLRASLTPPIGYNPPAYELVTDAKPDLQVTIEDGSLSPEEQYFLQCPVVGPRVKDWGYDLRGIGAQFLDSEFKEYVVCY